MDLVAFHFCFSFQMLWVHSFAILLSMIHLHLSVQSVPNEAAASFNGLYLYSKWYVSLLYVHSRVILLKQTLFHHVTVKTNKKYVL